MFTLMAAKLLRLLPNEAKKTSMIALQPVKEKRELKIETSIKTADISVYYPLEAASRKLPVYMNLHGGAFIMHEKEMDDPYCRYLANQAECVVVNMEYAKAPEYPFPKPIEQLYEVFQWIKLHADDLNIDAEKIMVGGQSSGANLVAALCLYLQEKGETQPLLQVLTYPMLDFVTPHADKPEPLKMRAKFPQAAHFLNMCYVPQKGQAENPLASPVYAQVSERLAPALILIAEYDAFRPEAERYAEKLNVAGVKVQKKIFEDCKHAFTHLGPKEKAEEAWGMIAKNLKETAFSNHEKGSLDI